MGVAASTSARRCVVLLVEDVLDIREMYAFYLRSEGYEVHEATDGRHVLGLALAIRPDVVVMDLALPGIDGWTATAQLRSTSETSNIPIVVLSAHAFLGDQERARHAGAATVLVKPCRPDLLADELRRISLSCEEAFTRPRAHLGGTSVRA